MSRASRFVDGAIVAFAATSMISIALSQLSMGLACIVWVATVVRRRAQDRPPHPLLLPFCAFLFAAVLSALATDDVLRGLRWTRSFWLPVVFFFVCVDRLRDRPRAVRTLRVWVAAGGLSGAVGLAQSLLLWARPPLPMDWTFFRIRGTLSHYMTFSGLLLFLVLMAGSLLVFRAFGRRDRWIGLAAAICLVALLMTRTRSAWLGLAVGVTLLVFQWRRVFVLFVPLAALLVLAVVPAHVRARAFSVFDRTDATATERYYLWSAGLGVLRDHPLLGVGPGNLRLVWERYRLPDDPTPKWQRFTHLHDNAIQIAAEMGSLGLACWLWIWVAFFRQVTRARRALDEDDRLARGVVVGSLACVAASLVAGIFEYNFGDSEIVQTMSFVMALPFALARSRPDTDGAGPNLL